MDRVPYRRITPPRNNDFNTFNTNENMYVRRHQTQPHRESEPISRMESITIQLIISGVLMLVVLVISLADIGPFASLRNGLRQALSGATTFNEFTTEVRHFSQEWLNFGGGTTTEIPEHAPTTPVFYFPEHTPAMQEETINIDLPPTAYDFLNPQIPGPLVVPGLWD